MNVMPHTPNNVDFKPPIRTFRQQVACVATVKSLAEKQLTERTTHQVLTALTSELSAWRYNQVQLGEIYHYLQACDVSQFDTATHQSFVQAKQTAEDAIDRLLYHRTSGGVYYLRVGTKERLLHGFAAFDSYTHFLPIYWPLIGQEYMPVWKYGLLIALQRPDAAAQDQEKAFSRLVTHFSEADLCDPEIYTYMQVHPKQYMVHYVLQNLPEVKKYVESVN